MEEIRNTNDVILFIDELHTLVGAGAAEGAIDAANILKPALSRGELQCIGATTLDEYRKYIEKDAALERRFQPVMVEEPYARGDDRDPNGHPGAVRAASPGADHRRGGRGRGGPVDPLHHGPLPAGQGDRPDRRGLGSRARLRHSLRRRRSEPRRRSWRRSPRRRTRADQRPGVRAGCDAPRGRGAAAASTRTVSAPSGRPAHRRTAPTGGPRRTSPQVVAMWTGIPVTRIAEEESERLLKMEEALHARRIGQEEAIETVSRAVRRARAGLKDPKRPIGSFIFLGPTGVGKTELAKALAEFMFGTEDALIKHRHERVHGAAHRQPPGRRASRLRRLRRGRTAHRGRPPQALLGHPPRRDREGASGRVQHPAPDPGGRAPHRRQGPHGWTSATPSSS